MRNCITCKNETMDKYCSVKCKRFYYAWHNMKTRCTYPNSNRYYLYGARGVNYDKDWEIFRNFFNDMYSTYHLGLSLDRIDNEKSYSKDNCRWTTAKEQANNTRRNRIITFKGTTKTLAQWADYLKIKRSTLAQRYYVYKWNINKCFNY